MCHVDLSNCFWSLKLPEDFGGGGHFEFRMGRGDYWLSGACPLGGNTAHRYASMSWKGWWLLQG